MAKLMSNLPGGASQAGLAVGDLALRKFQIEQSARQAREAIDAQKAETARREREAKARERMERARLQAIAQIMKGAQGRAGGGAPSAGGASVWAVPQVEPGGLPPLIFTPGEQAVDMTPGYKTPTGTMEQLAPPSEGHYGDWGWVPDAPPGATAPVTPPATPSAALPPAPMPGAVPGGDAGTEALPPGAWELGMPATGGAVTGAAPPSVAAGVPPMAHRIGAAVREAPEAYLRKLAEDFKDQRALAGAVAKWGVRAVWNFVRGVTGEKPVSERQEAAAQLERELESDFQKKRLPTGRLRGTGGMPGPSPGGFGEQQPYPVGGVPVPPEGFPPPVDPRARMFGGMPPRTEAAPPPAPPGPISSAPPGAALPPGAGGAIATALGSSMMGVGAPMPAPGAERPTAAGPADMAGLPPPPGPSPDPEAVARRVVAELAELAKTADRDPEGKKRFQQLMAESEARGQAFKNLVDEEIARRATIDKNLEREMRRVRQQETGGPYPTTGWDVTSPATGRTLPSAAPTKVSPAELESTERAGGLVLHGAPVATDYARPTRRRAARRPEPGVGAREERMIARLQKGAEAASALGKPSVAAQIQRRISRIESNRKRRREQVADIGKKADALAKEERADAKVLAKEERDAASELAKEQKKEAAKAEAGQAEDAGRDAYLTAETPEALKEARKGLRASVSNKLASTFRMRLNRLREIEQGKRIYETPAKLEAAALDAARKEMYGKGGALYLGMEKVIRRELNKRGANLKSGWFVTDDPVTKEHEKQYERIRTEFHRQRFLGDQQRLDARVGKGRPSTARAPFAQWVDGTEGGTMEGEVPTPGAAPAPTPPAAAPKQAAAPSGMSAAGKRVWRAMQAGEDSPQLEAMFEKLPKAEKDAIVRMARQRR